MATDEQKLWELPANQEPEPVSNYWKCEYCTASCSVNQPVCWSCGTRKEFSDKLAQEAKAK